MPQHTLSFTSFLLYKKYPLIPHQTNPPRPLFKPLPTIPLILHILNHIQHLSPHPSLLNFTNPPPILTQPLLRYTNLKKLLRLSNLPI
ncbi:family 4 glycosyl hydrolase, partial [Bacillus pumilus]